VNTFDLHAPASARPVQAGAHCREGLPGYLLVSLPVAMRRRYSQMFDVVIVMAAGMELVRRKAKAWFSENKGLSTELDIRRAVARGRQGSSRSFTRTARKWS